VSNTPASLLFLHRHGSLLSAHAAHVLGGWEAAQDQITALVTCASHWSETWFLLFDSTGIWTQGPELARQALYYLSHGSMPVLLLLVCFRIGSHAFLFDLWPWFSCLSSWVARITGVSHHGQRETPFLLWNGNNTFCSPPLFQHLFGCTMETSGAQASQGDILQRTVHWESGGESPALLRLWDSFMWGIPQKTLPFFCLFIPFLRVSWGSIKKPF
jgi:hypothetical protein